MKVHEYMVVGEGTRQKFFGRSWEDQGFVVEDGDVPTHDRHGREVVGFYVREADVDDAELLDEAFGGVEKCNLPDFREWLTGEAGIPEETAEAIYKRVWKYAS